MTYTPTDEQIEKAAEALADDWNPQRDPILSAMFRDYANTVLVAVGPHIAAQGIREYVAAARENRSAYQWEPSEVFDDAEQWADQIEKEAR